MVKQNVNVKFWFIQITVAQCPMLLTSVEISLNQTFLYVFMG